MGVLLSDLSPKAREQIAVKLAIEEARKRRVASGKTREKKSGKGENKLHAKKVNGFLADGTPHIFDSMREYRRYEELSLLEQRGVIHDLRIQVPFELLPKQKKADGKAERAVSYIADFVYQRDGETVVEDSKGYRNPASAAYAKFVLKRKMMLYFHGITVREV